MRRRSYRFGDYRIDPALRELWRGNELIALPPQVFDFLTYLIERHDRAVGRDELVTAICSTPPARELRNPATP